MSFMVRDNNRAGMWMYAANHDDFLALQDPQPYGQEVEAYKKHVESTFYGFKYEEPTPTQFQEAHKKWRRILDERNEVIKSLQEELKQGSIDITSGILGAKEEKIRDLIQELHVAKEKIKTLSRELNNNTYRSHVLDSNPLFFPDKLPVLEYETKETRAYTNKLKEEVDKLRIANQEKDIEIQELRDQVTQQAAKWLVPNFK